MCRPLKGLDDALDRIEAINDSFYWLVPGADIVTGATADADVQTVVDWSAPRDVFLGIDVIGEGNAGGERSCLDCGYYFGAEA